MTTQEILQGVHDWTNGKIVYDISVAHPDGQGNPTKYADLAAALGTNGANIPQNLRKGGMQISFVRTYDNKYVQFRLRSQTFSINEEDWINEEDVLNDLKDDIYGVLVDLSSVNNSGYINSSHEIAQNDFWCWGRIPVSSGSKTITFNNLPAAQYSNHIYSYFVDVNNTFVGSDIIGNTYLGVRELSIEIPEGAVALMFSGVASDTPYYDIRFNSDATLSYQVQENTENIEKLNDEVQDNTTDIEKTLGISADLSFVNNSGFIKPLNHEIGDNDVWNYGRITVPEGTSTVVFDNLPSAPYSQAVCSYFVDENNTFIGNNLIGNTYLGMGEVIVGIPNGAVGLMFTGLVSDLSEYNIRFNSDETLFSQIKENINKIEQLQKEIDGTGANLSSITNSGFIKPSDHQIGDNDFWSYGNIPVPNGSKTIVFNNLPAASYSQAVCSYFVDINEEFVGTNLIGNTYLGTGIVSVEVPNNAVGLMFTGAATDVSEYNIKFIIESTLIEQVQENTKDIEELKGEIENNNDILIPDVIYAVVGTELNIWNDAVALSIDNGLYSPKNYVVEWNCNKGLVTDRCFRFTPLSTDIGSHNCTCTIYSSNAHNLIATKTFSIKVLSKNALNAQKRIVLFGDSLGRWIANKLYENFSNSEKFTGVAPLMMGTRGDGPDYHYEAVGGYTWKDYATKGFNQYRIQVTNVTSVNVGAVYSYDSTNYNIREVNITDGVGNLLLERNYGEAGSIDGVVSGTITLVSGSGDNSINFTNCVKEPNNPVWDESLNDGNGGLSFSKYRERLGLLSSEKIDAAVFQFGVNESLGNPNLNTIFENYIIPLYNAFIADNPNGKFIVGMTTSACNDANGAGANYGASRNIWSYLENTYKIRKMYLERLQSQYTNLIIAPSQLELDRYYGYAFSSRQISQRTTATEQYHNNFVHPGSDGYGQIADALFATYIGALTN